MPKLSCPCGFIHDLSPIPDDGWITIAGWKYEEVVAAEIRRWEISGHGVPIDEDPQISEWDAMTGVIVENSGRLYECPDCGRLIWEKPGEQRFRIFKPDEAIYKYEL